MFDPTKDEKVAKFPGFIKQLPCPWADRDIHTLSGDLKKSFLDSELAIARIETKNPNEVRDLFVRLQSGLPLNSQETRDAWPGEFTEFVLWLGGKPGIARYPGHPFFTKILKMTSARDRGKSRQLAAQIAMLFLERRRTGRFVDINSRSLNDFYYEHLDFDRNSVDALRIVKVFEKITNLIDPSQLPKLYGHDAIHLVLLVDSLLDDYVPDWQYRLQSAAEKFQENLAKAKSAKDDDDDNPYWKNYVQWTRVNSDRGDRIALPHRFYLSEMIKLLGPLKTKDPNRIFGEVERTIIYYRQEKVCAACLQNLEWEDMEIHHVKEHSKGGETVIENGAAVHSACHPRGGAATKEFAKLFADRAIDWETARFNADIPEL